MTRRVLVAYVLAGVLVSTAQAGTLESGAVGTLQLPDGVTLTQLPDADKAKDGTRTTWALDYDRKGGRERAALYQTCSPHIDKVSTTDRGIETLAIAGTIAGGYRLREPAHWTKVASQRAYRTDGLRGKNVLISQWLVPTDDALASIRFERVDGAPIEADMLKAIERIDFTCRIAATSAAEG